MDEEVCVECKKERMECTCEEFKEEEGYYDMERR
mgnify:CR=1 FL=1